MSRNSNCLNCDEVVFQKFCPNCGQKTDTHRITFKHFIFHDILHGVWHFERGIFYTIKELFLDLEKQHPIILLEKEFAITIFFI